MTIKPVHELLSSDDRAALREFWMLYEPRHPAIAERMRAQTARLQHAAALSPAQIADQERTLVIRRDALLKQRTIGALCQLCHEVGTLVVGEGVETLEERDTLVRLGCDLLQGYLIGRPSRQVPA